MVKFRPVRIAYYQFDELTACQMHQRRGYIKAEVSKKSRSTIYVRSVRLTRKAWNVRANPSPMRMPQQHSESTDGRLNVDDPPGEA